MSPTEAAADYVECRLRQREAMAGAVTAVFPALAGTEVLGTRCLPGAVGSDAVGGLIFAPSPIATEGLSFMDATFPGALPADYVQVLFPDVIDADQLGHWAVATGFDRDWNANVYLLRGPDPNAGVIALVTEIL